MDEGYEKDEALCTDVLRELIIIQYDVQHRFSQIRINGGQVVGETLDVLRDHSVLTVSIHIKAVRQIKLEGAHWSGFLIRSSRFASNHVRNPDVGLPEIHT